MAGTKKKVSEKKRPKTKTRAKKRKGPRKKNY
jgi:hypothetical protein